MCQKINHKGNRKHIEMNANEDNVPKHDGIQLTQGREEMCVGATVCITKDHKSTTSPLTLRLEKK